MALRLRYEQEIFEPCILTWIVDIHCINRLCNDQRKNSWKEKNDFDGGFVLQNYWIFPHVICSSKMKFGKLKWNDSKQNWLKLRRTLIIYIRFYITRIDWISMKPPQDTHIHSGRNLCSKITNQKTKSIVLFYIYV